MIENFAPPERASKLPMTSMGSMNAMNAMNAMSAMNSMNAMNAMNSMGLNGLNGGAPGLEEGKRISTPKARIVNRKRSVVGREEKIAREGNGKRSRVVEEDAYYLKMNTENLQALKAHLESVKLKEKELKQKKHKRKV